MQLYDPANTGNPTRIKFIQEHLQDLQKGPHAWLIANALLSCENSDLRFFGALTFTVKINHDWSVAFLRPKRRSPLIFDGRSRLSITETEELLGRLVDHYVLLVNGAERSLVLRKLASSLVTIFLKPSSPWTCAILNVAASLVNGKYVPEEQCRSVDLTSTVLPAMTEAQALALLYFSHVLAEEINRWRPEVPRRLSFTLPPSNKTSGQAKPQLAQIRTAWPRILRMLLSLSNMPCTTSCNKKLLVGNYRTRRWDTKLWSVIMFVYSVVLWSSLFLPKLTWMHVK